eukprot:Polyplicarium_translucidae@DN2684_c0_g1_i1.p1
MGGEMSTFNIQDGYAEALVRGMRSGFLTPDDYRKLSMAESLEDLRSALEETDYGGFLQDEPSPLAAPTVGARARDKLVAEFRFIRAQANANLGRFMDLLVNERMIDNVVNLIQGCLNQKSPDELLGRVDPLGWVPELKAITVLDFSAGYEDLYRSLLVDTPIGPYFESYIALQSAMEEQGRSLVDVSNLIREADLELMRNILKKAWLEHFYDFCADLGGTTAEVMCEILKYEADFRVLTVTLNALGTALGEASQLADRNALYPGFGFLYPEGIEKIRRSWNDATLRNALESYPYHLSLYEQCRSYYTSLDAGGAEEAGGGAPWRPTEATNTLKSFEDIVYDQQIKLYEGAFDQSMHYGLFYAWMKLKEQEIRNLVWMADMIMMKKKDQMDQVLPIFAPRT